jgi:two-component system chemotaxis response regulator CheY
VGEPLGLRNEGVPRILIVDDSPAIRDQVSTTLTQAGFEVTQASDGVEALEAVERTSGIGLIILDLNMPRMDGLAFLEKMRSSGIPSIPTVMLTTEAQTAMIERGKRAGAKGWLVKPFKREHLIAVARRLTSGAGLTDTGTTFVVSRR